MKNKKPNKRMKELMFINRINGIYSALNRTKETGKRFHLLIEFFYTIRPLMNNKDMNRVQEVIVEIMEDKSGRNTNEQLVLDKEKKGD